MSAKSTPRARGGLCLAAGVCPGWVEAWWQWHGQTGAPPWIFTYAHYLLKEEVITPFQRCHFEPCSFVHYTEVDGASMVELDSGESVPLRIVVMIYVDDGQMWDNCATVCDPFTERMCKRLSLIHI